MEDRKIQFREKHNSAVKAFNNRDYSSFLDIFRPALERFVKLLVFDFMDDENDAIGLINGEKRIETYTGTQKIKSGEKEKEIKKTYYKIVEPERDPKKTPRNSGKYFISLAFNAYFAKHPDIANPEIDDELSNEIKNHLLSCKAGLLHCNSLSNKDLHTDEIDLDMEIQAKYCAISFDSYCDVLKEYKIISASFADFLNTLPRFSFENEVVIQEMGDKIQEWERKCEVQEYALKEKDAELQEKDVEVENAKKEASKANKEAEEWKKRCEEQSLSMEMMRQEKEKAESEKNAQHAKSEEEKQAYEKEIQQRDEEIDRLNQEREEKHKQLNAIPKTQSVVYRKNDWDVEDGSLDEDQIDLINQTTDKSMLVTGCAGSGKSLIAAHKAELLKNQGENVILITLTTSLTDYMKSGKEDMSFNFFTYNKWKEKLGMPSADYIIVDEIQDFTEEEIKKFIAATNKHFFFFGDTAQSIYSQYKKTTTIERISELTGLDVLYLYNNYRLPRPVAKITEDYVGVNVQPYREKNYKSGETELPHIIKCNSDDEQLDKISQLVKEYEGKSIGILLPSDNKLVRKVCEDLDGKNVLFEYKFDEGNSDTQPRRKKTYHYTLDYNTWLPKVMTYHSAKGVQFDVVILPLYSGAIGELSRKELYVAMTRTVHCLYVLYSTPTLLSPLDKVPSDLYLKE